MKVTLFQGVLFGIFGFAALVGVFVFATHTGKSTGGSTAVGTVIIWGILPKTNVQNVLVTATQTNPSLKDVSYIQKSPDTLPSDLANAIATGNAPDLILASQE